MPEKDDQEELQNVKGSPRTKKDIKAEKRFEKKNQAQFGLWCESNFKLAKSPIQCEQPPDSEKAERSVYFPEFRFDQGYLIKSGTLLILDQLNRMKKHQSKHKAHRITTKQAQTVFKPQNRMEESNSNKKVEKLKSTSTPIAQYYYNEKFFDGYINPQSIKFERLRIMSEIKNEGTSTQQPELQPKTKQYRQIFEAQLGSCCWLFQDKIESKYKDKIAESNKQLCQDHFRQINQSMMSQFTAILQSIPECWDYGRSKIKPHLFRQLLNFFLRELAETFSKKCFRQIPNRKIGRLNFDKSHIQSVIKCVTFDLKQVRALFFRKPAICSRMKKQRICLEAIQQLVVRSQCLGSLYYYFFQKMQSERFVANKQGHYQWDDLSLQSLRQNISRFSLHFMEFPDPNFHGLTLHKEFLNKNDCKAYRCIIINLYKMSAHRKKRGEDFNKLLRSFVIIVMLHELAYFLIRQLRIISEEDRSLEDGEAGEGKPYRTELGEAFEKIVFGCAEPIKYFRQTDYDSVVAALEELENTKGETPDIQNFVWSMSKLFDNRGEHLSSRQLRKERGVVPFRRKPESKGPVLHHCVLRRKRAPVSSRDQASSSSEEGAGSSDEESSECSSESELESQQDD